MDRKIKTYKGEWYTVNSIFGNDWARFFYLLGGREAGKSYSVMRWAVNRKIKKSEHFKFYWMRLTDASADKLLASNGKDLIDPDLKRKYNVNLIRKGDTLYSYDEVVRINKSGKEVVEKKNMKEFCRVLSLSTFYNNKGQALYDNEFLRNPENEIFIVLDEMNREQSEKKSFDIVYNFVNQIENVIRSEKQNIKIVMIGNTLEEASDLLSAINFIPDTFGRYKLKSKHAVVDYIKPNEEYLRRRKDTVADIFTPNASTFTNEIQIDRTLLVNKRKAIRPIRIIKFNKTKDTWFTVYNNEIVKPYNNETLTNIIAMRRYLDTQYYSDLAKLVIEQFDMRGFLFTSISTFKQFQKQLQLIKSK